MKIKWNNDVIRRIISDDSCSTCWLFHDGAASCNPTLIDLCVTENVCYTFRLHKSADSIFLI